MTEIRKKTIKIEYEKRDKFDKKTTSYRNIVENAEGNIWHYVVSEERSSKTQIRNINLGYDRGKCRILAKTVNRTDIGKHYEA